jgi:hypothetical protein
MLQLFIISWLNIFHPFYVSVTEITHNAKTQTLEIGCRMFNDDLEKAVNAHYNVHVDVIKPADKAKLNQYIADYIKKHFQLKVDGKRVELSYLGYEIQEDAAWCYLEVKGISSVKKLDVHSDILYSEHPEQSNMFHVTVNGERKSTKVDNPETNTSFSF